MDSIKLNQDTMYVLSECSMICKTDINSLVSQTVSKEEGIILRFLLQTVVLPT